MITAEKLVAILRDEIGENAVFGAMDFADLNEDNKARFLRAAARIREHVAEIQQMKPLTNEERDAALKAFREMDDR